MSVSVIAWIMTCRLLHTKRKILVCTYIFLHLDEYLYHSEQAGPVTTFKHCSCPFGGEPMKGLTNAYDCFGEWFFAETHWVGPATNRHSTQSLEAFWSVARYFRCTLEALLVKSLPVCEKLLGRMQPRWCVKMQMDRRYDCAVLARDVLASQSRKPIAAIMLEHWINVHQLVEVSDPYLSKQTCSSNML